MATITLPHPNIDFVPLDILTAAEQNQLVANINALATFANGLADGTNLSDDIVLPRHIAPQANPVVEFRRASNYLYRKYRDGTVEMTIVSQHVGPITRAWAGRYISQSTVGGVALPVPISELFSSAASVEASSGNVWLITDNPTSLTRTGRLYIISPESISASNTYRITQTIVGVADQ